MPLIVGLSGASSSGKTTVAKILTEILPIEDIVHQDNFFLPDDQIPYNAEIQEQDWDCPEALDFESFRKVVKMLKEGEKFDKAKYIHLENASNLTKSKITVSAPVKEKLKAKASKVMGDTKIYLVDGFLMYQDPELTELLDSKLFFITDYNTLKQRRNSREYTVDEGVWTDPPGYFDKCVWMQYYKNHKALFVDGEDEALIKETGGKLNAHATDVMKIDGFVNNNKSDMDGLLEAVVDSILARLA